MKKIFIYMIFWTLYVSFLLFSLFYNEEIHFWVINQEFIPETIRQISAGTLAKKAWTSSQKLGIALLIVSIYIGYLVASVVKLQKLRNLSNK